MPTQRNENFEPQRFPPETIKIHGATNFSASQKTLRVSIPSKPLTVHKIGGKLSSLIHKRKNKCKLVVLIHSFSKKLAEIKNQTTNLAFVEPEPLKETDPLTFAQSKKQKAWQKTNQSSINMLPSFKTLEAN